MRPNFHHYNTEMILILSQNGLEPTTNEVIDWLDYFNANYIRINGDDILQNARYSIGMENMIIRLEGVDIHIDEINAVWFRRWTSTNFSEYLDFEGDSRLKQGINEYLKTEYQGASRAFFSLLQNKFWLTDVRKSRMEKYNVLKLASSCGLYVPDTLICNNKDAIKNFSALHNGKIITKPISEVTLFPIDNSSFVPYTTQIEVGEINYERFHPLQIQEAIEKQYEIRAFFILGNIYSMAIFSQDDEKTKQDFRCYNTEFPNRHVPYKLPREIEQNITSLMGLIGLNCGSIDLIKATDDRYIFLEINPVGQFGMTSHPCNYNLEKEVAELLIHEDKR